jgi:hypothetical protein
MGELWSAAKAMKQRAGQMHYYGVMPDAPHAAEKSKNTTNLPNGVSLSKIREDLSRRE